jgi:hypothetical protein
LIFFCQDWDERTKKFPHSTPSATEFDQYNDLILSDLWQMRSSDGRVWSRLAGAPFFPTERCITWKYSQTLKAKPVDLAKITPSCLSLAVKALAQAIYKDQRFQDMPILFVSL